MFVIFHVIVILIQFGILLSLQCFFHCIDHVFEAFFSKTTLIVVWSQNNMFAESLQNVIMFVYFLKKILFCIFFLPQLPHTV